MVERWETAIIGDYLDFKNGLNKAKEFFGYGTPIVNYMDVYHNRSLVKKDINGRVSLSLNEINRFNIKKGDVFFTRTSETPEEVGISSVLLEDIEDGVFSGFVLRGRPKNNMFLSEYCRYCFSEKSIRESIIRNCTYTTRALTNGKQLSAIRISVPPKPEQKAISSALCDIDSLIDNLEKLVEKKKNIKRGAMQELLTGKRRLPGFDGEWLMASIGDCISFQVGYPFSSEYFNKQSTGLRLIKNGDLKNDENVFYTTEQYKNEYLVNNNDILIGMDGDFLPCRWKRGTALLNQRVGRLIAKNADLLFVYYLLFKPLQEIQKGVGATTVKHLSHSSIEKLTVFMPSTIEEQTAIASILSDMDNEIEELEKKLAKYRNLKQGMMSELLSGHIRLTEKEGA